MSMHARRENKIEVPKTVADAWLTVLLTSQVTHPRW
jgi:hypothetical protein